MALARRGEDLAQRFAQRELGWTIVSRNFQDWRRNLEIDLVAVDHGTLVIAEVKTRSGAEANDPLRAIHAGKVKRLGYAARNWIARARLAEMPVRFDAITVIIESETATPRLEYFRDVYFPAGRPEI
jgi:putative endonuclease